MGLYRGSNFYILPGVWEQQSGLGLQGESSDTFADE